VKIGYTSVCCFLRPIPYSVIVTSVFKTTVFLHKLRYISEHVVHVLNVLKLMAEANSPASLADASLLKRIINDLTQCPICQETLSHPKLLPCFHSFCAECLQKSFPDDPPMDGIPCPVCRGVFSVPDEGFESLPPHFFAEHLLDAKEIVKQLTMEHRCDICRDDDDSVVDDESGEQIAASYCGECNQYLCNQCSKYDTFTLSVPIEL